MFARVARSIPLIRFDSVASAYPFLCLNIFHIPEQEYITDPHTKKATEPKDLVASCLFGVHDDTSGNGIGH